MCSGNREDYDNWHRLGNPTWDFDSVLEYFKKSEGNLNETIVGYQNGKYHSDQGGLPVSNFIDVDNKHMHIFMEAAKETGYRQIDDFNADETLGFTFLQGTVKDGQRVTTAKAFLIPAKNRKNLHIIKHAHVTKIIVNELNVATGVEFTYQNEHKMQANAKKEVILSAGSILSPQLLMLSGIGPREHLEDLGIPVIKHLSVGKNLQDHVIAPVIFQFDKFSAESESIIDTLDDIYNYAIHRKGSLAGVGSVKFGGLINSENHTGIPDIEVQCFDFKRNSLILEKVFRLLNYNENVVQSVLKANSEGEINDVYVQLLRPESTGEILLRSTNPNDPPRIIPNYFGNDEDKKTLVRGIQFVTELLKTKSFKEHKAELVRIPFEDCDKFEYRSNDYWECYLSHVATTVYHPIGTCKMGPDTDRDAVVDSELKVKGIKGLRVIDASIMPKITSSNTNAATIMIAEKGADFIKSTWLNSDGKEEL